MKLSEAEEIVRKKPKVQLDEILQEVVEAAWQDGLYEVVELLEEIGPNEIALWVINTQGGAVIDLSNSYQKATGHALNTKKLSEIAIRQLSAAKRDLLEKVASFSEDRGLPFLDFLVEARASSNLASQIQKNATKQGLYEPIAAAYININSQSEVLVLAEADTKFEVRFKPDGTALVEDSGKSKRKKKASDSDSKSADLLACVFEDGKCTAYLLSHKFARVGGGHQMNQRTDAVKFLAFASLAADSGHDFEELRIFINSHFGMSLDANSFSWQPGLVLDGKFFQGAKAIIESNDSYPALRSNKFFIGTSDEFLDHLENQTI